MKSYDFVKQYFSNPQLLVKAIKEYRRTANIHKGECTGNFQHTVSNIILASAIRFHNCFNEVLRNISIVSQQLLGVLGQTVSTITEAGVVVVACQYEVDRGFSRSGRFYADDFGTAHYCSGSMTLAVKKSSSME